MTRTPHLRDRFGICQWFHFEDYHDVERSVEALLDLGVRHLRTGIAWADLHRPGAKQWFDWQMEQLEQGNFEVLVSVWHTPPSISEANALNSPPRRLRDYADAVDFILTHWGDRFTHLELWNEPNNAYKWNFPQLDPRWEKFGEMIRDAAHWAKQGRGKPTVLGGMIPVDHHWLDLMDRYGVLQHIDVVAIHAFPGMWWPSERNWDWHETWGGWQEKLDYAGAHARGRPVWVTETGVATWDLATNRVAKYDLQVTMLEEAVTSPAERTYWYSLIDLNPAFDAIEGFHVDENEYHMGLIAFDGHRKDAYFRFKELMREDAARATGDRARPRSRPAAGSTAR